MIPSAKKMNKATSKFYIRITLLLIFSIVNCNLLAQEKIKPVHSLSFGVHKNPFLNHNYISADTSFNQHIDVIYAGYKYDDELAVHFGWTVSFPLNKTFSIKTGSYIWQHNNTIRSQKDSLMKYYSNDWMNPPYFIRNNSFNIEVPVLIMVTWKRLTVNIGTSLHIINFKTNYYEKLDGEEYLKYEINLFENKNYMHYNSYRKYDFFDYCINISYSLTKSDQLKLTSGISSIKEINMGFIYKLIN